MSEEYVNENDINSKHLDFYRRLRAKITRRSLQHPSLDRIREFLLLAPDLFYLLIRLLACKEVELRDKGRILGAVVYFVSPVDLLPEAILGLAGYADDIVVAAMILNPVIKKYPDVVQREWAGDGNVLELVRDILNRADEMVGKKIWNRLKRMFR